MADDSTTYQSFDLTLPIDTSGSTLVPGRYITDVGVQWGINDLTLLFFEAKRPLSPFADPEQSNAFMQSMGYVPADCAGRMIFSIERAQMLHTLLGNALSSANDARFKKLVADCDLLAAIRADMEQQSGEDHKPKDE